MPPVRTAAKFGVRYRPLRKDDLEFVAEVYASSRREELAGTGWSDEAKAAFSGNSTKRRITITPFRTQAPNG